MRVINIFLFLFILSFLSSCGDREDGKVSKGHRDAIKIQCEETSNVKACGLEVRENFIEDGNEYADFSELNDDQVNVVKFECVRSKKYGLVAYNNCLEKFIDKALGGNLFADDGSGKTPTDNIEKLEQSTVYIEVVLFNNNEKTNPELLEFPLGTGSGVIISKKEIATNCHVALMKPNKEAIKKLNEIKWEPDDLTKFIWIRTINGKDWAEAKVIKKNERKDICILKHEPKGSFKIAMKPTTKFVSFEKLKKGNFVRAMGSPGGMIGHTSTGDIQWLGTAEELNRNFKGALIDPKALNFEKDTKFIVHSARVHQGSSGGPLFDDDGGILGLNTLISYTAAENIAVSADHIKELLFNK